MARSLFVTPQDIIKNSLIQGDIDPDKMIPFIEQAQDKQLQDWLGENFYTTLDDLVFNSGQDPVPADNINAANRSQYKSFINDHLRPIVEQLALWQFMEFAPYTVSNKGVFKHTSDQASQVSQKELRKIINKVKDQAEFLMERAQDFLCNNSGIFPEYITTDNSDLPPSYETYDYGWTSM